MLEVDAIDVSYGDVQCLYQVSLKVEEGGIVALVGSNASGKSTALNTISGLLKPSNGEIRFQGRRIDLLPPHRIVEQGIVQIPEGRRLFPFMTVLENLEMGCYTMEARRWKRKSLEWVFQLLPVLEEKKAELANSLSGGEQQMLAIGRGLMARPRLLLLDEPSLGLAPLMVKKCFEIVKEINQQGTTILLVEQNVHHALSLADRGYVLENGRIVLTGKGKELLADADLRRAYLGL
ncbi:MAG: ABC transporter ATP-binding protein [candidate division NC10 bacterium]|nr:ABC transporter ATP-binding protein [candidate division NC10 bacterium]